MTPRYAGLAGMAWRVELTFSVFESLLVAFVIAFVASIVYLLVRFVVRMRSDDELEAAHRLSDHITGGGHREQTPEEAVEEWEWRCRHPSWARRHMHVLVAATAAFLAASIALAAYLYLTDSKTRPSHCPPQQCGQPK
jgi:hypothetical protein